MITGTNQAIAQINVHRGYIGYLIHDPHEKSQWTRFSTHADTEDELRQKLKSAAHQKNIEIIQWWD